MNDFNPELTLKLAIQRALLDEVQDHLYAVTCGVDESRLVRIVAYFDGSPTEEDIETIGFIGTETIASFPAGYRIDETCLDASRAELACLDFWAFRRKRKPAGSPAADGAGRP